MEGKNGAVTDLTVSDVERVLYSGAGVPVEVAGGADLAHSQLEHALQTAAVLREWMPDDDELMVAGLVHDIGHLLPGVNDANHASAGAAAVRHALGERVAALVGLHVEAKRYLVTTEGRYGGALAPDSVASLVLQGGPITYRSFP